MKFCIKNRKNHVSREDFPKKALRHPERLDHFGRLPTRTELLGKLPLRARLFGKPPLRTRLLGRLVAFATLLMLIIIPQTGCSSQAETAKTNFCLDTQCTITIYDTDEALSPDSAMPTEDAERILDEAFTEIKRYENLLSKTVEGSDVDRINKAGGQPTEVSDETMDVIRLCMEAGLISGGKFDMTIGAVTELWDFKSENPQIPSQQNIDKALTTVDYTKMRTQGSSITLTNPDARLDFGGVAKGYIADRIGAFLKEKGVEKAIVNLGGNIVTVGQKDEDTLWNIGIERPYSDRTEIMGTVQVADATVVTSGIYERNFQQDGVLYHHVLDPATGYPVETDLEAITLVAAEGNSGFCDSLSTICILLGKDKALALIESLQEKYPEKRLEAALMDKDDNMVQTDGMQVITEE